MLFYGLNKNVILGPNPDNWVGLGVPVQFSKVKIVSIQVQLCQKKKKSEPVIQLVKLEIKPITMVISYNYVILLHY